MIELLIWLIVLISRLEPDMDDSNCFEDESVVMVLQTWTGTHHENANITGALMCVPNDDMRSAVSP